MEPRPQELAAAGFPDPVVSGNIYCSGRLGEVLLRAIVPLRRGLERLEHGRLSYLWCVRYNKGGQHLKVRIHGPEEIEPAARQLLQRLAADCLAAIGAPPAGQERVMRPEAIPIDEEDHAAVAPPDRSFTFTRYGRSHVSLGGEPFLSQQRYRELMTRCLARGCDQGLDALESQGEVLSHPQSQRLLLKSLLSGMAALRWAGEEAAAYLAYHRDWLIRFPLLKTGGGEEKSAEALAVLERRSEQAAATVESLRRMVEQQRTAVATGTSPPTPWQGAVADLFDHVARFRGDPSYRQDPFAGDPSFTPVFKVFHGLGNLLGFGMLDEAYAHHLLLQATTREPARYRHVALVPQ